MKTKAQALSELASYRHDATRAARAEGYRIESRAETWEVMIATWLDEGAIDQATADAWRKSGPR